ncbi:MAG TPA: NB-ARC domain-containing protein, partial [Thermomicrobiales bacterium]|nr:NB-ARC domain-containing protein [Thermomicrobiales bacterium]
MPESYEADEPEDDDRDTPIQPAPQALRPLQPFALPAQPTPLIGRDQLVNRLANHLESADVRLLTLLGPGGVGKTRLACELARRRERDHELVRFIDLAQFQTSAQVAAVLQSSLGPDRLSGAPDAEQLVLLGNRRTLLVLDNFEHLVVAAPLVADLLAEAPWLQIIATSRTALRLRWEHVCAVPPLMTPPPADRDDAGDLATIPSVALFVTFARRFDPEFSVTRKNARIISDICRQLEGLPLALELAAADLRVMSLERLKERVGRPLDTLIHGQRDMPQRQQTLRATIEWSYSLLSAEEQRISRQLAIFAGGGTIPAIAEVLGLPESSAYDLVANLADQNLFTIVELNAAGPRVQIQHMVREYLLERLSTDEELPALRDRYMTCYSRLATELAERLYGPEADETFNRLESDADNFRAILDATGDQQHAGRLRLALALMPFWESKGHLPEGRRRIERLIERLPVDELELRFEAHLAAVHLAILAGDLATARRSLDMASLACTTPGGPAGWATVTSWAAYIRLLQGDPDGAARLLDHTPELAGADRYRSGAFPTGELRARIAAQRGDDTAPDLLAGALNACNRASDHIRSVDLLCLQAEMALGGGDAGSAARLYAEALVRSQVARRPRLRSRPLIGLGDIAIDQLTADEALRHYHEAFLVARDHQDEPSMMRVLERVAILGISSRIYPNLLRMYGLASAIRARLGVARSAYDERLVMPKLDHARSLLGNEEFERIMAGGTTLTIPQVINEMKTGASLRRAGITVTQPAGKSAPLTIKQLTRREREVVQQISKGFTNRQIAANLGMAE